MKWFYIFLCSLRVIGLLLLRPAGYIFVLMLRQAPLYIIYKPVKMLFQRRRVCAQPMHGAYVVFERRIENNILNLKWKDRDLRLIPVCALHFSLNIS